jgi:hypothetical protein
MMKSHHVAAFIFVHDHLTKHDVIKDTPRRALTAVVFVGRALNLRMQVS